MSAAATRAVVRFPAAGQSAQGPWPHLAMLGALAITRYGAGITAAGRHHPDTGLPEVDVDPLLLARAIHAHTTSIAAPDSVWRRTTRGGRRALLAADWGKLEPAAFEADAAVVREVLEAGALSELDRRLLIGLGRPTHPAQADNPRAGASGWDLSQLSRGGELLSNQILPTAAAVAARSVDDIAAGLTGATTVPVLRSSGDRGLRDVLWGWHPRNQLPIVDSAIAWCALAGLTMLPTRRVVVHDPEGLPFARQITSGYYRGASWEEGLLHLPARTDWWPAETWAAVLASRAWADLVDAAARTADRATNGTTITITESDLWQTGRSRELLGQLDAVLQWERVVRSAGPVFERILGAARTLLPPHPRRLDRRDDDLLQDQSPAPDPAVPPAAGTVAGTLRVTYLEQAKWPVRRVPAEHITALTTAVTAMVDARPGDGGIIGCVVAESATAVRVADGLAKTLPPEAVLVRSGGLRPMDTERRAARLAGHPPTVIVSVADAEVETTWTGMVAELMPAAALIAAAARVTPVDSAVPVTVIGPSAEPKTPYGPHSAAALRETWYWLRRHRATSSTPAAVPIEGAPAVPASLPRLGRANVPAGHPQVDLTRWWTDDITAPARCGIVLRGPLPTDAIDAITLLNRTPLAQREIWWVPITLAAQILADLMTIKNGSGRAFVVHPGRGDGVERVVHGPGPQPGDILILDAVHRILRDDVVVGVEHADPAAPLPMTTWGLPGTAVLWRTDPQHHELFGILDDADLEIEPQVAAQCAGHHGQVTVGPPLIFDEDQLTPWVIIDRTPPPSE